jgi:hypothetical protein
VKFHRSTWRKSHEIGSWQVRVREPGVSEPLMRCRNVLDDVKTGVPSMSQDKSRGNLFTAWMASGRKVAGTRSWLLCKK